MSENREPARLCAFCDVPWSARMTAAFGVSAGCACCGGAIPGHWPLAKPAPPMATEDLICDSCGKTLYLAPSR